MKPAAGLFLAGAKSRLLPMSLPFRYFGAAVVFHVLAWAALLAGAGALPRFAGGLGWPLAALHLVTLGVLVMTAIGASLQLLPVATRAPVGSLRAPALLWWLVTPGVAAVALGMGLAWPRLLGTGAVAVALALAWFALLLAANLRRARGMPVVVAHVSAALVALGLALASALSLAGSYLGWPGWGRATALQLHIVFAAYGFMGLLALGFSHILVPMFALAAPPDERQGLASCALAVLALALAALAAAGVAPQVLQGVALLAGAGAVGLHLRLMLQALRTGMRRELGRSFTLVRIGWGALAASLVLGLALVLVPVSVPGATLPGLPTLFGGVLIGGWLLSFLLGLLQRILPFLASMHAARGSTRAPTPGSLSPERPLAIHFAGHLAGLGGLALAVLADSPWLAAVAAAAGLAGALAFGAFFVGVLRRTRGAGSTPPAPVGRPPAG